jgi:hypothetical protein
MSGKMTVLLRSSIGRRECNPTILMTFMNLIIIIASSSTQERFSKLRAECVSGA